MTAFLSAAIAVLGTLGGAYLAGWAQLRQTRLNHAERYTELRRTDRVTSVVDLCTALSNHRRAMWRSKEAVLTGASADQMGALREEAHRTRSSITAPAARLQLEYIEDAVLAAAADAAAATYSMRDAGDLDELDRARHAALAAHDRLVEAARMALTRGAAR